MATHFTFSLHMHWENPKFGMTVYVLIQIKYTIAAANCSPIVKEINIENAPIVHLKW